MFLAKITKPYYEFDGVPFFLPALSYGGVITVPKIPTKWPQSAGIDPVEKDPLLILKKCST